MKRQSDPQILKFSIKVLDWDMKKYMLIPIPEITEMAKRGEITTPFYDEYCKFFGIQKVTKGQTSPLSKA